MIIINRHLNTFILKVVDLKVSEIYQLFLCHRRVDSWWPVAPQRRAVMATFTPPSGWTVRPSFFILEPPSVLPTCWRKATANGSHNSYWDSYEHDSVNVGWSDVWGVFNHSTHLHCSAKTLKPLTGQANIKYHTAKIFMDLISFKDFISVKGAKFIHSFVFLSVLRPLEGNVRNRW